MSSSQENGERIEGEYKITDSGHFPMITKPVETARAILDLSK